MRSDRPQLRRQLTALFGELEKLKALSFIIPEEDAKAWGGSTINLKACKANLIKICDLYEKIADKKYAIAVHATTSKERESLLNEALEHCSDALDDLEYIRVRPSASLLSKYYNLTRMLDKTHLPVETHNNDEMEIDLSSPVQAVVIESDKQASPRF